MTYPFNNDVENIRFATFIGKTILFMKGTKVLSINRLKKHCNNIA
jgi:hypothetical protein